MRTGSDFSGVGAFDQALMRLGIVQEKVFACDWDKYARQTYIHNYGELEYYPKDVYDREIPSDPLDIYMTSPPCQAFSLAGNRKGEDDDRGILFYNSHEFIVKNKPRYFIFENVKGLLSDAKGRTFQIWLDMLGGKSVNGNPVLFPREDATPYHIYYQVLNAKHYGIPQNRERVFIIGIRDDQDNNFTFPKPFPLNKRLKDVLEYDVDEKYYLSESAINSIILNEDNLQKSKVDPEIASALQTPENSCGTYKGMNAVSAKSATSKDTACNQRVVIPNLWIGDYRYDEGIRVRKNGISPCMYSSMGSETSLSQMTPIIGFHKERIRRLTPRECFRLMDFPDSFTWPVSDTQAYKQAGNSICVGVLVEILKKLIK